MGFFPQYMQNIVAPIAGATLGYIYNNLRGARDGFILGKMAPIRYGRKRTFRAGPYPTPRSVRIRSYKSLSGSRTSTGSGMRSLLGAASNTVVTRQHDFQGQYRYKRMPRYKRRRWVRFMKKVAAVQLKQAGLKTVVFNSRSTVSTAPGFQNVFCLGLYGVNGTVDGGNGFRVHGWNDIYRIFKNDPDIVQSGAVPGNVPVSGKLQFGSGVLDFTLRNLDPGIEAEVDIYYGYFYKDDDAAQAKADTNPIRRYEFATADVIRAGNSATNISERGNTLFDKPAGISECGYHVTKKVKMLLAPGQSTFIQHRDPKNHMIDWTNVKDVGYAKRKLTFGIWIVFKPSVTASDDAVSTLSVGVTRKYSYAIVEDNVDRIAYNPPN